MRTILVPFTDHEAAERALDYGCRLAQRFRGHVEGLYVEEAPQIIVNEIIPAAYVTQVADDAGRTAESARGRYRSVIERHGIAQQAISAAADGATTDWQERKGRQSDIVGDFGRLFELLIVSRTERGGAGSWRESFEAALFESGRPVLVTGGPLPDTLCETVAVIWNGSTETARAITVAMPLLALSKEVVVITVEGGFVPGPSGEQVATWLRRAGLNARYVYAQPGQRGVGEAMLAESGNVGADLVIKGAYTQSRLRQMIFGGPTDHIVGNADLPVLFAR